MPSSSSRRRPPLGKGQTLISRFFPRKSDLKKETYGHPQVNVAGNRRKRVQGSKGEWIPQKKAELQEKKKRKLIVLDEEDEENEVSNNTGERGEGESAVEFAGADGLRLSEDDKCVGKGRKIQSSDEHEKEEKKCEQAASEENAAVMAVAESDSMEETRNCTKSEVDQEEIMQTEKKRQSGGRLEDYTRVASGKNEPVHRNYARQARFERKIGRLEKNSWFMKRTGGTGNNNDEPSKDSGAEDQGKGSAAGEKQICKRKVKYTPLESQFVAIKKKHPDTVLMVECGYKFRFFGDDARIASKVCRIWAHFDHNFNTASIPTHRLGYHLRRLVQAGYKVGVVRQTDTAALKKASSKSSGPFARELTEVYSRGTLIPDAVGGTSLGENESSGAACASSFILSISESRSEADSDRVHIALAAVDATTGEVVYDTFDDNILRANLETRLVTLEPVELVLPRSRMSVMTERVLRQYSESTMARLERLRDEAFGRLANPNGVRTQSVPSLVNSESYDHLPEGVSGCLAALSEFLSGFKLEDALLCAKTFSSFSVSRQMEIGGEVMRNFEFFVNSHDGSSNGSLLSLIDRTSTAFGSRQLKSWMAHPLTDTTAICDRLDAVECLRKLVACGVGKKKSQGVGDIEDSFNLRLAELIATLPDLPDLQRGLARIFYAKCSPSDFSSIMKSIDTVAARIACLKETRKSDDSVHSQLLSKMILEVPDVSSVLSDVVSSCLDMAAAEQNDHPNLFLPGARLLEANDQQELTELVDALNGYKDRVVDCETCLDEHLKELRVKLSQPRLEWKKVALEEFLVEVPVSLASKMPKQWLKVNQTKAMTRFRTPETINGMELLEQARELRDAASKAAWRSFLRLFSKTCSQFQGLVRFLSDLDCLCSLARVSNLPGYSKPKILDSGKAPAGIHAKKARHPIGETLIGLNAYVPNDIKLGIDSESERCLVITGPNMGGKSSYVRMSALIVILAQIGCFVPAESVTLSPFDAIFVRMGAADAISKGLSTFMVELSETSAIISRATPRSLVILDELGRGTSTHDGTAVAFATLEHLVKNVCCRTFFITHFPSVAHLKERYVSAVGTYFMDYLEGRKGDPSQESPGDLASISDSDVREITFLYKLKPGVAQRSYGLNVARLADLPDSVICNATRKSAEMENKLRKRSNEASFARLVGALAKDFSCSLADFKTAVS